jgi:alkaline phosphatase D
MIVRLAVPVLLLFAAVACDDSVLVIPPYDARIRQDTTPWTSECTAVACSEFVDRGTSHTDAAVQATSTDEARQPLCACPIKDTRVSLSSITHGPVLGAITDKSVKIWVRSSRGGELSVRVWPTSQPSETRCSDPVQAIPNLDNTAVVLLSDLEPATMYAYQVSFRASGEACVVTSAEAWSFRTLPEAGRPSRIRFVVGADVSGADVPGFAEMQLANPDFVLMIGDNAYVDVNGYVSDDYGASFARYQALYQEVWGGRQFRDLFSRIPVFMIWDDHEIMENYWAGKNDLRYAIGRRLYDSYQHYHNPAPTREGELYYAFTAGDVGFFVMDTRSHRDGNMLNDDVDKTMLGAAQRLALEEWLTDKTQRVHVIVSSVIVSPYTTTGADPWRSFSVERDAWLAVLAENATPNTFVVSGDQHWSAVIKLMEGEIAPYSLYEFQTTPLGSGKREVPQRNDELVMALDNKHRVFGVFDIDTRHDPPLLDFTLCAVGRACEPHMEPAPQAIDHSSTTVPYSLFFQGGARGFELLSEQPL